MNSDELLAFCPEQLEKKKRAQGETCKSVYVCLFFFMLNTFTGPYLHALVHEGEDIATSHQLLNGASQSFCQSTKKIQSHNHEVFVGGLILFWLGLMKLENIT